MGNATGTRPLTTGLYLTDDLNQLIYVLDLPKEKGDQAVIEDARTGTVSCVPRANIQGWRVVEPEHAS